MSDSSTPASPATSDVPARRVRNVAHALLDALARRADGALNEERARAAAGAGVSPETCRRALRYLEQVGVIVEIGSGVWHRRGPWRGTQADWYT